MSKGPAGGRSPGRRGKAGVGPGPGYRPGSSGGGTRHTGRTGGGGGGGKGSGGGKKMFQVAVIIFGSAGLTFATAVGYVVYGHITG